MLPKIAVPQYSLIVPSTGESLTYRPFTMREQKLLLVALESDREIEMLGAVHAIVDACTNGKLNSATSPMFDVQYAYLQIRAKSVGEVQDFMLICGGCDFKTKYTLDLTKIVVEILPNHSKKIPLTDTLGVIMKYPTIDHLNDLVTLTDRDQIYQIVASCIETIYDGDEVYATKDEERKTVLEFINNLTLPQYELIQNFFRTMPVLRHEIKYNCSNCSADVDVTIEGIESFFV